ncbi:hypothetical protein [Rhodococcus koreensis]
MSAPISEDWKRRKLQQARLRERRAAGIPTHIPVDRVRDHVLTLLDLGMTIRMVSQRAGVSHDFIYDVRDRLYKTCRAEHAYRVLAADHHPTPAMVECLSVGASRRIRALHAIGWSGRYIGDRFGVTQQAVSAIHLSGRCTYKRWAQFRDLYEELSMTPGPSDRPRACAVKQKWRTPLEWEGYDIDDPRIVAPLARGHVSREFQEWERSVNMAEAVRLSSMGLKAWEIAERMHISDRQVQRLLGWARESA